MNTKFKKIISAFGVVAFLAINLMFLMPRDVQAQELFGQRADCYWRWTPGGQTLQSFIKCDDCTRIEAYNPTDDRRCRFTTPE